MTKSEKYAVEMSKERKVPIVLFGAAEIAHFMLDPSLFPMVETEKLKGWRHMRTIVLNPNVMDEVDRELTKFVEAESKTYGFGIVGGDGEELHVGVFDQVPKDAEVVYADFPFQGTVRVPARL